jgi:hypothetical protein
MPVMKKIFVEYGSVVVQVNGDTLTAQMINRHGTVRDLFSIVKRGKVEPRRLALPWQPPAYVKPASQPGTPAEPPVDHKVLIAKNADWAFEVASHPQGHDWTLLEFNPTWPQGRAPFGFGDGKYATRIERVPGKAPAVYMRKQFTIAQADAVTELGLIANYSDGLIAYINGHEVARSNIGRSSGARVQGVKARTERGPTFLTLRNAHRFLRNGVNMLAIEAHANAEALDFWIDPVLVLED